MATTRKLLAHCTRIDFGEVSASQVTPDAWHVHDGRGRRYPLALAFYLPPEEAMLLAYRASMVTPEEAVEMGARAAVLRIEEERRRLSAQIIEALSPPREPEGEK